MRSYFNMRRQFKIYDWSILSCILVWGCVPQEPVATVVDPNCRVPEAGAQFTSAICQADGNLLAQATLGNSFAEEPMARLMERLWTKDATVGSGLDWSRLNGDQFRVSVAAALSQSIRNGFSDLKLSPMQQLAIRTSRLSIAENGEMGIALLGYSNTAGQEGFLRNIALHGKTSGQRIEAIMGLGSLCTAESTAALREVVEDPDLSKVEKELASEKLYDQQHRTPSWCHSGLT